MKVLTQNHSRTFNNVRLHGHEWANATPVAITPTASLSLSARLISSFVD